MPQDEEHLSQGMTTESVLWIQGAATSGLLAAATEVWAPGACAPWQEKPRQQGAWAQQPETNPWSPQLKEALKTPKDPAQPKKKKNFF